MRVIKSDPSGIYAYQKILKHIHANNSLIVVWQFYPQTGERVVSKSRLNSIHLENGLLHFELTQGSVITTALPLYCYSEDGQFIFKTAVRETRTNVFSVSPPDEIKLLEDPDVTVIRGRTGVDLSDVWRVKRLGTGVIDEVPDNLRIKTMAERSSRDQNFLNNEFNRISIDEEDKMFADKRESPRARPKIDKWVKVLTESVEEVQILRLFDLSQGGIGFITTELDLFPKGLKIRVIGFDEFNLDDPLIAQVMSHRPIDDLEIEFKVGCKFDDGQA